MQSEQLRKAGLKTTTPRMRILQILATATPHHMSAEQVYQKLHDMGEVVGLATVYRVLTQFETAGLVKRHNFEGDFAIFELEQGQHHDHLVCVRCGKVTEFVDEAIESRQRDIAEQYQYQITDHTLTVYGICNQCPKMTGPA